MHLFNREQKLDPESRQPIAGAYFFGHFNSDPLPPFSVSHATFQKDFVAEKPHYHRSQQKVYVVLEGKAILMVNGQEVLLEPEHMVHVEPGEVHFVQQVLEAPFQFVVVTSAKIDDKVVIED